MRSEPFDWLALLLGCAGWGAMYGAWVFIRSLWRSRADLQGWRKRAGANWQEFLEVGGTLLAGFVWFTLLGGLVLVGLYGIVRFVKWAWMN